MQVLRVIFDKQRHCKPVVVQSKFLILMSFIHSIPYIVKHTFDIWSARDMFGKDMVLAMF